MIESLFVSLFFLLLLTYISFKGDLTSPSFMFISGFTICSYIACGYKQEWGLIQLHFITYYIIVGGSILCYITEFLYRKKHRKTFNIYKTNAAVGFSPISVNKLIWFAIFQTVVYIFVARYKMSYAGGSLAYALAEIDQEVKYEDSSFALPWYLNVPNGFCQITGFIWGALFVFYYYLSDKYGKQKKLILLNLILTMSGTLLSGGRMPLFDHLISFLVIWLIYNRLRNKEQSVKRFSLKSKIIITSLVVIFALIFTHLGSFIGREKSDLGAGYLFAVYCGAQIRNIDDFIVDYSPKKNRIIGEKTFNSFYEFIQNRLGISLFKKEKVRDPGFNQYGGFFLGNVYSAFKPWYSDFQNMCIFVMVFFSFIACFLYRKCLESDFFSIGKLNIWFLLFCLLVSSIFQSFFSELFLRRALSIEYVLRAIVYFYLAIVFLEGKKIKLK